MSEPAVGQLLPSVFGHSECKEDVCVKIQQMCVIDFCVKLGKSGNETLEMLWQAYGGETQPCCSISVVEALQRR